DAAKNVQAAALGGADGVEKPALWILGMDGKVYRLRGYLSGEIKPVETLENNANVYRPSTNWGDGKQQGTLQRFKGLAVGGVAPGEPMQTKGGEKVLALDWDSKMPVLHLNHATNWLQMGPRDTSAISVGDDGTVVRLDNNGDLYRYDGGLIVWKGTEWKIEG